MIVGLMCIILYSNLMTMGYDFYEYFNFIITRVECLLSVIGLIIINITIFWKKEDI